MFDEQRCPECKSLDYEVQDYNEEFQDDYFTREWYCKCSNCKTDFTISELYELKKVEVKGA